MPPGEDWVTDRDEAVAEHHARLQARRDAEHREAEAMLATFVRAATQRGLPPVPLRVQGHTPKRSTRTDLEGWYLRRDERAAVDTSGNFYLLNRPLTFLDAFRRVRPRPSRPPLVLGAGGRDGEAIELRRALDRLLPGWET